MTRAPGETPRIPVGASLAKVPPLAGERFELDDDERRMVEEARAALEKICGRGRKER